MVSRVKQGVNAAISQIKDERTLRIELFGTYFAEAEAALDKFQDLEIQV